MLTNMPFSDAIKLFTRNMFAFLYQILRVLRFSSFQVISINGVGNNSLFKEFY